MQSGTGTTALVFGYTVEAGDADDNGVEVEANKLSHNSGSTIKDAANNDANTDAHPPRGTINAYSGYDCPHGEQCCDYQQPPQQWYL